MMVTQLENQDPTQPMSNSDLLAQISQIGQLQSSDRFADDAAEHAASNQSWIGLVSCWARLPRERIATATPSRDAVNSLQVTGNNVTLQLDSGSSLPLANVTMVAPVPATGQDVHAGELEATRFVNFLPEGEAVNGMIPAGGTEGIADQRKSYGTDQRSIYRAVRFGRRPDLDASGRQ